MGKANKCNLTEDKTLAEVIKKYQYLYDKVFPFYTFLFPLFKYSTNPLFSMFSFKPSFPNSS